MALKSIKSMRKTARRLWLAGGSLIITLLMMGGITLDAHINCRKGQVTWMCRDLLESKIANGYRFTKLIDFAQAMPGQQLISTLLEGHDGYLYGQTIERKTRTISIFRLSKNGQINILARITKDGGYGNTSTRNDIEQQLVQDKNGYIYGFLPFGGKLERGSIFRITQSGKINILAEFNDQSAAYPIALVVSHDDHLYGLTNSYPKRDIADLGYVFSVAMNGELKIISSIPGLGGIMGDYWRRPVPFFQGRDGFIYGCTLFGGKSGIPSGKGNVFKVSPSGQVETLFSFGNKKITRPMALIETQEGLLYGTTFDGGVYKNKQLVSAVFNISKIGGNFKSWSMDIEPANHSVSLVQAKDGNFYGVSSGEFGEELGTIYQISSDSTHWKTLVKQFGSGSYFRSVMQTHDNTFYITAINSRNSTGGEIYTLNKL
jgi:hypothetical protein